MKLLSTAVIATSIALMIVSVHAEVLQPLQSWTQHEDISQVMFSPDSNRLVIKSNRNDEPVTVRDTASGELLCAWARSYRVSNNVAPNGKWLFVDTAGKNMAHFRDVTNCNYIHYLDNLPMYAFFETLFSSDGHRLAGIAHPRRPIFNRYRWAYVYDIKDAKVLNVVKHRSSNLFGMWDDKFHFFADGETVMLWLKMRKVIRVGNGQEFTYDRRVLLQNVLTEEIHRELLFRSNRYQLAIHPDETKMTVFNRDAMNLHEQMLFDYKPLHDWPARKVAWAMEYHPSGKWLMTVSYSGGVVLYDMTNRQPIREFKIATERIRNDGLTFAPDGEFYSIHTSDGKVALYGFYLTASARS